VGREVMRFSGFPPPLWASNVLYFGDVALRLRLLSISLRSATAAADCVEQDVFATEKRICHDDHNSLSLSYGFLLAALAFKSTLLGPDYSDRLFLTVQAQSASGFILFLLALRKSPVRVLLASSALTISLAWFLIWAINTTF
jgi:hypothetical protein